MGSRGLLRWMTGTDECLEVARVGAWAIGEFGMRREGRS